MPCQCELIIGDKTCEDRLSRLFEWFWLEFILEMAFDPERTYFPVSRRGM